MEEKDSAFFSRLSKQQSPKFLWIGCSDSRVPANQIIDLPPGELFVHRNIANIVSATDLNGLSVIQFAVELLKVRHIIVCGHYGCSGVEAAMTHRHYGMVDGWLDQIKNVASSNSELLQGLEHDEKFRLLCELNVLTQVKNVCATEAVQKAWQCGAELSVHGWVYNIENGILVDLGTRVTSQAQ